MSEKILKDAKRNIALFGLTVFLSLCDSLSFGGTFSPEEKKVFKIEGDKKVEIGAGAEYNAARTYHIDAKEVKSTLTISKPSYSQGTIVIDKERRIAKRISFDMVEENHARMTKVPPKHINTKFYELDNQGKPILVSNEHYPIKAGLEEKAFDAYIDQSRYFPRALPGFERQEYHLKIKAKEGEIQYKAPGSTEFVRVEELDILVDPKKPAKNTIRINAPKTEVSYIEDATKAEIRYTRTAASTETGAAISAGRATARAEITLGELPAEGLVKGIAAGIVIEVVADRIHKTVSEGSYVNPLERKVFPVVDGVVSIPRNIVEGVTHDLRSVKLIGFPPKVIPGDHSSYLRRQEWEDRERRKR